MNTKRVIGNGVLIFLGIGIYFLLMEALGLSREFYLRVLNLSLIHI